MNANHFLKTSDLSPSELYALLQCALRFKHGDERNQCLNGKSFALVFFNPSLRTRASMQVAIHELGGFPIIVEPGGTSWTLEHRDGVMMDSDRTEHVAEFVRVLGRYCVAIGVRTFAELKNWKEERLDPVLTAFAKYSEVPVVNLESAMHHPLQALADMMTIRERFGQSRRRVVLVWAWHPKPLPMAVPNSFCLAAAQVGHHLTVAHPPGYALDEGVMEEVARQAEAAGGSVTLTNDVEAAFVGADVIYAKSWGAKQFYGAAENDLAERLQYRNRWIVDQKKMKSTNNAIFMHCLPVRRNVIVTDDVIDSPSSVVIDQAENRLHVQKAILSLVNRES